MALPTKVKEQGDRAEELAQQHLKGKKAPDDKPVLAPEPKPIDEPTPINKVPTDDYQERFARLKQKYDQLVPEQRNTIAQLQGKIELSQSQVEKLTEQVAALTANAGKPAPSEETNTSLPMKDRIFAALSPEERAEWNDDLLVLMGKVAMSVSNNTAAPAENTKIDQRVASLETAQKKTDEDNFWDALYNAVPNWSEIQNEDAFEEYMNQVDPLLGVRRIAALEETQTSFNSVRAIAIFKQYLDQKPPVPDGPTADPVESLLTPENAGGGSGEPEDNAKTFTDTQVNKFYVDVANGKYNKDPEKAAAIEAQIQAAGKANRIIKG